MVGTGALAYYYYKLLNYFIRIKIETDPEPKVEEPKPRRKFRVQDSCQDDDSEEERNKLFTEINDIDMKIERI